MARQKWLRSICLGVLVATLFVTAGCQREGGRQEAREKHAHDTDHVEERIALSAEAQRTVAFRIVTVQRRGLEQEIRTTAVIESNANRLAHISPRIPGRVVEVKAFLGDVVKAGHILAELDSLELGQAKAAYLTAKADREIAQAHYQREERLFRQQISAEKEYLAARGEFLRADIQWKAARETLRLLGLADREIEQLDWRGGKQPLSRFPLLAPFAGTVVEKHVALGALLKPEDHPYTVADLSTLWVVLDIYEKDLNLIHVGAQARLMVDAYPGESFQGTITYISDLLDKTTRTAQARVEIANPDRKLKPGMFVMAVVTATMPNATEVLAIPAAAVHRVREQPVAFVREAEGVFVPRQLKLGYAAGEYVEILEGLTEGEQVVTEGGFYLKSALLREEMGGEHAH
jgi:cobalt-zinc-cadmium efflux system membrane fusion protein